MRRSRLSLLLLLLCSTVLVGATPAPDPIPDILKTLSGDAMKADALVIAGTDYAGRGSGEPGLFMAAEFIEARYRDAGIQTVAADSYRQTFTFASSRTVGRSAVVLRDPIGNITEYEEIEDYQPFPYGGPESVEGPLVFVGYGISAPDLGYDDYAGIDVTGKIVFVMRHAPNHEMDKFGEHATFTTKAQTAKERGAIGMVLVTDPNGHDSFEPLDFPEAALNLGPNFAACFLHTRHADDWLTGSSQPLAAIQSAIDESNTPMSFALESSARIHVPTVFNPEKPSDNVVGYLPGRDPKLAKEVVVIGAHLDHLGSRGDRIFAGADDNASGSVALLAIAEALGRSPQRPKRSILFVHFSGEELGLLGSEHYVATPLIPAGAKIVAMLNMDMVGLGNGGVTVLTPKEGNSQRLTRLVAPTKQKYFAKTWGKAPLNFDEAQGNSDHAPFASAGIPAIFLVTSGDHPDYHQIGDTPEKLQPEVLQRASQLCLALAWRVAEEGVR